MRGPLLVYLNTKYAGLYVKYEKFGGSSFRSREISDAFDVLEKAMILNRAYPAASKQFPIMHNLKKSPKIIYLDVGLINYKLGLRSEILKIDDLNSVYHGQISEQIVGQTLLTLNPRVSTRLACWYREKKGSTAEIDYLIGLKGRIFPLEVKSGASGKLKSIHVFMEEGGGGIALRVYSGNLSVDVLYTPKRKKFILLSIPFYLLHRIEGLLEGLLD